MGTYSPDPEIAELQQRWLARERALRACASALPVDEHGNLLQQLDQPESLHEPGADRSALIQRIHVNRRRLGRVVWAQEVWQAGVELTQADRSALADAAQRAMQHGDSGQERFSAAIAYVIASTYLHKAQRAAAITIAAAPPDTVRNMFWADYEYFHASVPPKLEWPAEAELRAAALRHVGDGLRSGFATPEVEPLASRLERASRVNRCKQKTFEMLADLHADGACTIYPDVRVEGISVDFLTLTWKGVFLIWSVDQRWTTRQAAMVMPVRDQIQRELGEAWPGQVEAVFHSPREGTGWDRRVMVDGKSDQPVDIVIMGGRIDRLLREWQPISQVGVDPDWLGWISQAAQPRWWRSDEGRHDIPAPPPHEQL